MSAIETVLVANRGEIAVRVMRTAKALGLKTVAVYSDADAAALHVRQADMAIPLGGLAASESYLNAAAILEAAQKAGADAVHPGYGFLSENTAFAAACAEAGVRFIGPPATAVEIMGDKALSKRAMLEAGVPCIPGYQGDDQSIETLIKEAEQIGTPVMIKAAAGGGGRGMRRVEDLSLLSQAIELARSEAQRAFGNDDLILERALQAARHVEIQIFADAHGNVIHLGERDCSLQRRHQKIIEESPCPVMTPELRRAMGAAAVEAARAVAYVGAGTVEFLLDASGDFFFLEMNTRLQVEHPVTEAVTGFDLVQWQIRVAQGEQLPVPQEEVDLVGHAIEVRLCAEDPASAFLPSSGPVSLFKVPTVEGVRVDTGVETGDAVSPFYDSMVAKIIARGPTRDAARIRLRAALEGTALMGVTHNREFLMTLLSHPTFVEGLATTDWVDQHFADGYQRKLPSTREMAAAIALQQSLAAERHFASALSVSAELRGWVSTGAAEVTYRYAVGDHEFRAVVATHSAQHYEITIGEDRHEVICQQMAEACATMGVDGVPEVLQFYAPSPAAIEIASQRIDFTLSNLDLIPPESQDAAQGGSVTAPMHGQMLSLLVEDGEQVEVDQRLAVFEAMKMQHEILAPVAGIVTDIRAQVGQQMAAGDVILTLDDGDDPSSS
jgi:geranyl-CoA carboxylase alpha subunit